MMLPVWLEQMALVDTSAALNEDKIQNIMPFVIAGILDETESAF